MWQKPIYRGLYCLSMLNQKKESLTIGVKGLCDIGVNNRGSTILCRFWLLLNISYNYHRSDNSAFGAVATFSCFFLFFVNFCLYLFIVCTFIALTNTTPILLIIKWKLMKKCMGCPHSLHKTMHNIWISFLTSCYK